MLIMVTCRFFNPELSAVLPRPQAAPFLADAPRNGVRASSHPLTATATAEPVIQGRAHGVAASVAGEASSM
jgi:hypothetical protein